MLCIDETKLDTSFPDAQFHIEGVFKELIKPLSNIARKYENVLLVGDLNIDTLDKKKDSKDY